MRPAPTFALAALILATLPGRAPAQAMSSTPPPARPVVARTLITVADDFVVEVYRNGVKLPDDRRELLNETFGATVERISVDLRSGDWVVFNVVNNRLRWGGASYFGVAARGDAGVAFTTDPDSGAWSCCDDPGEVAAFIANRDHRASHHALAIANLWTPGDGLMSQYADGWKGKPVWGASRNTWIKVIVP